MDTADIDRGKLKALASDSNESSESISEKLGLGKAHNLHYHLKKEPELKRIYDESRESAGKLRKTSAKAPRTSSKKSAPPARMGPSQARAKNSWRRSRWSLITSMCTAQSASTSTSCETR